MPKTNCFKLPTSSPFMLPLLLLCITASASAGCCSGSAIYPLPGNPADCITTKDTPWKMVTCNAAESCMTMKCTFKLMPSVPSVYSQNCGTPLELDQAIRSNAANDIICTASAASRAGIFPAFAVVAFLTFVLAM